MIYLNDDREPGRIRGPRRPKIAFDNGVSRTSISNEDWPTTFFYECKIEEIIPYFLLFQVTQTKHRKHKGDNDKLT